MSQCEPSDDDYDDYCRGGQGFEELLCDDEF